MHSRSVLLDNLDSGGPCSFRNPRTSRFARALAPWYFSRLDAGLQRAGQRLTTRTTRSLEARFGPRHLRRIGSTSVKSRILHRSVHRWLATALLAVVACDRAPMEGGATKSAGATATANEVVAKIEELLLGPAPTEVPCGR